MANLIWFELFWATLIFDLIWFRTPGFADKIWFDLIWDFVKIIRFDLIWTLKSWFEHPYVGVGIMAEVNAAVQARRGEEEDESESDVTQKTSRVWLKCLCP